MSFLLAVGADKVAQRWRRGREREAASTSVVLVHSPLQHDESTGTMEDLCRSLRDNKLRTLSIGWNDSDLVRSDKAVHVLEKAWLRNRSVTKVSVGLRIGQSAAHFQPCEAHRGTGGESGKLGIPIHTRNRRLLCLALDRLLVQKSPHTLLSLRLVLDEWVPAHLLQAILQRHGHLQNLELHGVTCRNVISRVVRNSDADQTSWGSSDTTLSGRTVDTMSSSIRSSRSEYAAAPAVKRLLPQKSRRNRRGIANVSFTESNIQRQTPLKRTIQKINLVSVIMPQLTRLHAPLQSLKLIDCELVDEDITFLANALMPGKALHTLSLRSNRRLTGQGVRPVCLTPYIAGTLDLSLCDFIPDDAVHIADALARRKAAPLPRILLCGNYQLDTSGLVQLVQPAVLQKVAALDLSFCELGESRTTRVLEQLANSHVEGPTALREVILQGCTLSSTTSRRALLNLLHCPNTRIHTYRLNDPVETGKYWTTDALRQVAAVLPGNYDVEEFTVDYMHTQPNVAVWKADIKPWLDWNALGRRVVVPGRTVTASEWVTAIGKASAKDDLDVLYWFIRQSTHHLGRLRLPQNR